MSAAADKMDRVYRCNSVMGLIDTYIECPNAGNRLAIREALLDLSEFEAEKAQPEPEPMGLMATDAMALTFHRATSDGSLDSDGVADIKAGLSAVLCNLAVAAGRADAQSADRVDAERLDWLDAQNLRFKMGWKVGKAPMGNVSISSVIFLGVVAPISIRDAIDAAMLAARAEKGGT